MKVIKKCAFSVAVIFARSILHTTKVINLFQKKVLNLHDGLIHLRETSGDFAVEERAVSGG